MAALTAGRGVRVERIGLAVVVLGVVAWTLGRLDWAVVLRELANARPGPLSAAAALVVVPLALRSVRARSLLASTGHPGIPFGRVAAVTVFGFSMSSVTPAGSGDLLRVAALRPYGVAAPLGATLVVFERALDLVVMGALFGAALAWHWLPAFGALAATVLGLAAIGVAFGLAARLGSRPASAAAADWQRLPAAFRRALPDPGQARTVLAPPVLAWALAITVGVFAFEGLRPWLVMLALGVDVGPLDAWAIFTLAWAAGLASLLPLGVGSWEAAAVWAFALYGVDPSTGAAGAVLLRAGVTLPALVLGLVAFGWLRRRVLPEQDGQQGGAAQGGPAG